MHSRSNNSSLERGDYKLPSAAGKLHIVTLLNVAIRAFKVYGFDAIMSLLGRQPLGCVRKYNYQTVPNRVVYALKNRNNLNNIL